MTQPLCPRCHAVLHIEDEGALVFCWNCGAPQVRLSEDLITLAEQQRNAFLGQDLLQSTGPADPNPDPSAVVWKSMIRIAAAVCAFFVLPSIFLLPLSLLVPAIVLQLYASRFRKIRIGSALGARVGLICGLFMSLGMSLVSTIGLLLYRFTTDRMSEVDTGFLTRLQHLQQQAAAQGDTPGVDFLTHFTIPEFRVGIVLFTAALGVALFVILSTASGAFAGFVRARTQTHTQTR
ncbi:MAG: hypothetical protein V4555_07925 [Acidobacteriota bacterium]